MRKMRVRYDTSDPRNPGWVAWISEDRKWQPIVGCEDRDTPPDLGSACECDPVTYLDPLDYEGVIEDE